MEEARLRSNASPPHTEDLFLYPPRGEVGLIGPADTTLQVHKIEGQISRGKGI